MCATARSRVNDEETPQSLPRGARMKDYSDTEAVQYGELGLVSTMSILVQHSRIKVGCYQEKRKKKVYVGLEPTDSKLIRCHSNIL